MYIDPDLRESPSELRCFFSLIYHKVLKNSFTLPFEALIDSNVERLCEIAEVT